MRSCISAFTDTFKHGEEKVTESTESSQREVLLYWWPENLKTHQKHQQKQKQKEREFVLCFLLIN